MHKIFKNDWLQFHYNLDVKKVVRTDIWDVFTLSSNCSIGEIKSFLPELDTTCLEVYQEALKNNKKLGLFLSGGVDSEIIARSLLKLEIPFEPFFISFKDNLNDHEYELIKQFTTETGKDLTCIELDILNWLTTLDGYSFYQKNYKTFDIATPLQMWARDQISSEYAMISGLFEPHLHKIAATEQCQLTWMHAFDESSIMSRYNFLKQRQYCDYPFFYLYRPELYAAYSFDPFVEQMIENPHKLSLSSTKKSMMKHYFPEMYSRPKYTGFEKIKKQCRLAIETHTCQHVDGQIRIYHKDIKKSLFQYEK